MASLLLGACIIGFLAYGYWLMNRLERYVDQANHRQSALMGRWHSFRKGHHMPGMHCRFRLPATSPWGDPAFGVGHTAPRFRG